MERLNKKILFLSSWYPSKEHLTLGNFVQKHAENANKVAHVDVLYAVSSKNVTEVTIEEHTISSVRTVVVYYPKTKNKIPFFSPLKKKNTYLKALQLGYERLNTTYDLIHLNVTFPAGLFAVQLKQKYKIPYILTVHWTGFLKNNQGFLHLPIWVRNSYRRIFKEAKEVFPVSEYLGESLIQLGLIKNFTVLNNVIETEWFYSNQSKSNSKPHFVHVSTFDEEHKNSAGMLRCFAQLTFDHFLHIITEKDKAEVEGIVKSFHLPEDKYSIESRVTPERVGELMRQSDALVLFSNYETFSVVLAEAWSSGIPAIYSQCGGLTELSHSFLGIQVQPKDETALLEALKKFNVNDYPTKPIVEFAEQFNTNHLLPILLRIYSTNT